MLTLREHAFSFSGVSLSPTISPCTRLNTDGQDDFTIKDNNGYPVIRCEGQAFSFRDRKGIHIHHHFWKHWELMRRTVITDPNGKLLFQLTNKMFSLLPAYEAEDANGQPLFLVRKRFGCTSSSYLFPSPFSLIITIPLQSRLPAPVRHAAWLAPDWNSQWLTISLYQDGSVFHQPVNRPTYYHRATRWFLGRCSGFIDTGWTCYCSDYKGCF
jgi:hypothetical protein